eukprot:5007653-Pyramimonas_sp.AAC.1
MSRIDRIYTNIFSAALLELHPKSLALVPISKAGRLSDRAPACLTFSPGGKMGFRVLAWVPNHVHFPICLQELLDAVGPLDIDPTMRRAQMKDILVQASKNVLQHSIEQANKSVEEKIA